MSGGNRSKPRGLRARDGSSTALARALVAGVVLTAGLFAASSGCGAFDGDEPGTTPPLPTDDDAAAAAEDATPPVGDGDAAPEVDSGACRPRRGPACDPDTCARTMLRPATPDRLPFDFATDATHVFWAEQDKTTGNAYDGVADGLLLRMPRRGGAPAELVKGLHRIRAVARVGNDVVFATIDRSGGAPTALLHRVAADCQAPCTAGVLTRLPGAPVAHLRPLGDQAVVAISDDGTFLRVDLSGAPPTVVADVGFLGAYPGLAVLDRTAIAGSLTQRTLRALPEGAPASQLFSEVPPYDGPLLVEGGSEPPSTGLSPLAADCTHVWGVRQIPGGLALERFAAGGRHESFGAVADRNAFDLAVDDTTVWLAMPNAGGIFALRKGEPAARFERVVSMNVFAFAVDDDAVFWGDHDPRTGGAIYRLDKRPLP